MQDAWEAKLRGETGDAEERMQAATDLAQTRGYRYLQADAVAKLPIDQLLKRVDNVRQRNGSTTKQKTRPLFSDEWIRDRLLKPGALTGLNTDARLILLGMINTGYRPSEGAGLVAETIVLDAKVPHIFIRAEPWCTLKTAHSERKIPLTGISLEAFREAAQGFSRYRDNSATQSATVNKFLAENKLLETPDHSMYSLRHSFEDRMLRAGIDARIRRDMLGHILNRERYGDGGWARSHHGALGGHRFLDVAGRLLISRVAQQ